VLHGEVEDPGGGPHHLRAACERAQPERRRQEVLAVALAAQEIRALHLHVVEDHFEELVSAHGVERQDMDSLSIDGEQHHVQRASATRDHDEIGRDVSVLHEELASDELAGHLASGIEGFQVEASGLLHQRHGRDAIAERE
jgi:hypothetical protein